MDGAADHHAVEDDGAAGGVLNDDPDGGGDVAEPNTGGIGFGHGHHGEFQYLEAVGSVAAFVVVWHSHRGLAGVDIGGIEAEERAVVRHGEPSDVGPAAADGDGVGVAVEVHRVSVGPQDAVLDDLCLCAIGIAKPLGGQQHPASGLSFWQPDIIKKQTIAIRYACVFMIG